jgi:carbamoyltransferase
MIILGINAYHPNSSACLLVNGETKIALEEERINRIKYWSGLPINAIKCCLKNQNIEFSNIDYVAINQNFFANIFSKIKYTLYKKPDIFFLVNSFKNKLKKRNILNLLRNEFGSLKKNCKLVGVEHHKSHIASAFFESKFDKSVNLSVDGFGDFASVAWGLGNKEKINIDHKILFPNSLGIFYESFTQFLGFSNFGEEYKVMGLSSLGNPIHLEKIKNIIKLKKNGEFELNLSYFNHHKKNIIYSFDNVAPKIDNLFSNNFINLFGNPRKKDENIIGYHKDLAASVQKVYEEVLFHILNYTYDKYKIDNLTLSGGCAQNSLANGKIIKNTRFQSLFVPSNPGDGGGSVGAAYSLWGSLNKKRPSNKLNCYLGNSYSNNEVENVIINKKKEIESENCNFFFIENEEMLCNFTAEQLDQQKVIGWFQGNMEWGPRALGNRSIISDPRNSDIKNILNLKIKRRESFRPFAPSILFEEAKNWFEDLVDEEPHMSRVLHFKNSKKDLIPGVVHVDGTGRLQTVKEKDNPRYYKLISCFNKITGVPIILNTSFNENEPIVFTPENALNCFLRTKMDILIIENWVVVRN